MSSSTSSSRPRFTLVIGNRNYSSWSLRAWLHLQKTVAAADGGLDDDDDDVEVVLIPIYTDNYKQRVLEYSPSGRVPALVDRGAPPRTNKEPIVVWDSLAIMEYLNETHNNKGDDMTPKIGWPTDPVARALARSAAYEMHSGFLTIRDELPQNLKRIDTDRVDAATGLPASLAPLTTPLSDALVGQVARVDELWQACLTQYGKKTGNSDDDDDDASWLFGTDEMTMTDVLYAPVALRFVAYGIAVSATSQRFVRAVTRDGHIRQWMAAAADEPWTIDFVDALVPAAASPLIL